jgi:hypothetical protein
VEPFLTLVIALGGIVTGIGAIWTAVIARRQVQITEKSFAEQNERARLSLEFDLLNRLDDRRTSPLFMEKRRAAAQYLSDRAFGEDEVVEVASLNLAAIAVVSFYEELGEMLRLGVLSAGSVWNRFGLVARAYWSLCKPAIEKMREEMEDPSLYEDFEYLCRLMDDKDRERGIQAPTQETLRQLMEEEVIHATIGEESPTST